MGEGRLEPGERTPEPGLTLEDPQPGDRCRDGTLAVAQAVLPELGDLDPGHRREDAVAAGQPQPRSLRLGVAAEPPEQPGSLGHEAALGPGGIETRRLDGRPGGVRRAAWTPAEVSWPPGRPPRLIVGVHAVSQVTHAPRRPHPAGDRRGRLVRERLCCPVEGRVEAGQCLVQPRLPGERAGQAGEIADRCLGPSRRLRVSTIDVDEQSRQRANVLVVVAHHVDQSPGLAIAEELQVAAGDLPARDVRPPAQPEEAGLDGRQPGVPQAMAEHPPDERQQVEMTGVSRRPGAGHPVAGHEQGPVEAAAVVRHEPRPGRDPRGQLGEQGRLVGMVGQEQLFLAKAAAFPPPEPDEKGQRPRGGGEPGRLGVEADERRVRGWLARQSSESLPVEWQHRGGRLDPDEAAPRRSNELTMDRLGEPLRTDRRRPAKGARRNAGGRAATEAQVGQSPFDRDRHDNPTDAGSASVSPHT